MPEEVQCATHLVWENRERKAGRKIPISIVILRATGRDRAPDPVFLLSGGPGQGATEAAPGFFRNAAIRTRRDIVLVDQRGTGGSNPLDCDLYGDPPNLQKVVTSTFPLDSVRACRERLARIADLGLYTTAAGIDDLDEIRQWLGYRKINLLSASYGTLPRRSTCGHTAQTFDPRC